MFFNFDIILVYIVILFILVSLYKEIIGPGFTFIIGVSILGIFKIITPAEILSGLANEQIAIIIMLLLLGEIYRQTSLLDIVFDRFFRNVKTYRSFLARMTLIIAPLSAFLNNTPLVAILMPYAHTWGKRNNISVSKLLIPLSYAAILGGCATLIGTSTNMIVNGLVIEQTIMPDLEPIKMFDYIYVGIPMIVIGLIYVLVFGKKFLPDRNLSIKEFPSNREYLVEVHMKKDSDLIGKTILDSKIENIEKLTLFQIIRSNKPLAGNPYKTILCEGDILLFTSDTESITNLLKSNPSMVIPSVGMFSKKKHAEVSEIVISHNSSMIGKTLRSENLRAKYDATVLAVHRNGERLSEQIETITLKAGDAILLLVGDDFNKLAARSTDFYIISKIKEIRRLGVLRSTVLIGGSILIILLSALGVIKLFLGLVVLLTVSILMKIANPKELAKSIDYELALIIAMSLALGTAMIKTGVAEAIAEIIITLFKPIGQIGTIAGIYLITTILAAFITNKAAVAIVFPVALTIAKDLSLPPMAFILTVSFAAAANFMTPIGYQTNTMIYGPGGYKFKDFLRVGIPLTVIYMVVTVTIISYMYLY